MIGVTGDLKVAVADNREFVSFRELAELGGSVDVYSESKNGIICVRKMVAPRVIEKVQVYKVKFRNTGQTLRGVENQPLYLMNGESVELKDLKEGMHLRLLKKVRVEGGRFGIFNRETRDSGAIQKMTVLSVSKDTVEDVYCGNVDNFNNCFVGNFRKDAKGFGVSIKLGSK